jgi:2'-5' RNA ligase
LNILAGCEEYQAWRKPGCRAEALAPLLAGKMVWSMRLFTGISLAPNVVDRLSALLEELKPTADLKWSPISNLHITCKFIGAWQEDRLAELKAALDTVRAAGPIPITISGCGFFSNSFFAGVQAGPALAELASTIDQSLLPLGCPPETRAFHPHVTLARFKRSGDLPALRENVDFGSFTAREFHLYLSEPTPRGSVYTKLATYDLVREQNTN